MRERFEHDLSDPNAKPFTLHGNAHAVMLIHGFTGTPGHMRPLGEALNHKGFSVLGILLPGHGTRLEDMRHVTALDYINTVTDAVRVLRREYERVTLAGLSMGGLLSLIAAGSLTVDSVVTLSAPLSVRNKLLYAAGAASRFVPVIKWRDRIDEPIGLFAEYDFGYSGFPTEAAAELRKLITISRKNLAKVRCPVLAVQSDKDQTISKSSSATIIRGISSDRSDTLRLKHAPHVVTLSDDLNIITEAIASFIQDV